MDETPQPAVRIRRKAFRRAREARGLTTDVALAQAMSMTTNTLWRVRTGRTPVSSSFIAGALVALAPERPEKAFAKLFSIEPQPPKE